MTARSAAIIPSSSPAKLAPKPRAAFPPPGVGDNGDGVSLPAPTRGFSRPQICLQRLTRYRVQEWITDKFCGSSTTCAFLCCWPVVFCPVDRRRIYVSSRGVRYFRNGRKVPRSDGWRPPLGAFICLLGTLVLIWALVHRCETFDTCTDWCKNDAMFTIANNPGDPTSTGLAFIARWGDDMESLRAAIEQDGLIPTLGAADWEVTSGISTPRQLALESSGSARVRGLARPPVSLLLEDATAERIVNTATSVDIIVITARFQTSWGPPNEWYTALTDLGWTVKATFSGTITRGACEALHRRYLATFPAPGASPHTANESAVAPGTSAEAGDEASAMGLPVDVGAANWRWLLDCSRPRVDEWLRGALARADLGYSVAPTPTNWPTEIEGLCVWGLFEDGLLRCD